MSTDSKFGFVLLAALAVGLLIGAGAWLQFSQSDFVAADTARRSIPVEEEPSDCCAEPDDDRDDPSPGDGGSAPGDGDDDAYDETVDD